MNAEQATTQLLAACARAVCTPQHLAQIGYAATQITDWHTLPQQAEAHGMAPLLYTYFKAAQVPMPFATRRLLQGLYVRHQQASRVRVQVLGEILQTFASEDITVCLLKGAALAHLIYPDPGLRPMRDVDLLVSPIDAGRAQNLVRDLGFDAPRASLAHTSDKHLPAATLYRGGFRISLEIHHNLFDRAAGRSATLSDVIARPLTFPSAPDTVAYTLGHTHMLWHLCQHLRASMSVFEDYRLIWVADIVSYAEHYVDEIDWSRIRASYPSVLRTLSLVHHLTPLSKAVLYQAAITPGHVPQGIGENFRGWPHAAIAAQRDKGLGGILRDTFAPPAWWLRLSYDVGSERPLLGVRLWRHPWHILMWVWHWIKHRF